MSRRLVATTEAPGQDSFLDIVANLVGILIILVMVVGARARSAMIDSHIESPAAMEAEIDVETPKQAAAKVEKDINQLQQKIDRQRLEIAYRRKERDLALTRIKTAERELEADVARLGAARQQEISLQQNLREAHRELEQITRQTASVNADKAGPNVIKHRPTPMAKTVFGKELHFRLSDGRLAFVPWDEMIKQLKAEVPEKAWKLKSQPTLSEVLGPIEGFRMRYRLAKSSFTANTPEGLRRGTRIDLDNFVLVPTSDSLGEPLAVAFKPGSQLQAHLADVSPRNTTVTVWVYPDSFADFRILKEKLFEQGFLTASRPLPAGELIGGSPRGSKTVTQ